MLKALFEQLRKLADEQEDSFIEEIKRKQGGKVNEDQIKAVKEFIFLLPAVLEQMIEYFNTDSVPSDVKQLSGHIIAYIYNPSDFVSEEEHGLFGYIDDAFLAVSAFLRMQDSHKKDWQEKSKEELELLKRSRELIHIPELLIPNETKKVDQLLDKWVEEDRK